jgi:hypothetical protein
MCFFNWVPRHEVVLGEWMYSSTHSLTSTLDGGEWLASRLGRFTTREKSPNTHWIGGRVGPRAILDAVVKRKISSPRRGSNPRTRMVQTVATATELFWLLWKGGKKHRPVLLCVLCVSWWNIFHSVAVSFETKAATLRSVCTHKLCISCQYF